MAEALQNGRELHIETAASILGVTYEDALARYKSGDAQVKEARQLAKAANFGFPGGLGASSFASFAKAAYGLDIEESRAKALRESWLNAYPEMRRYFDEWGRRTASGSCTVSQIRSNRIRGDVGYCDGANTLFQGLVADGAKRALWHLTRSCYLPGSPLSGCRMVAFIHDEVIVEVPADLDKARAAAKEIERLLIKGMSEYVPDVPIKADAHLMERWYKNAEPAYNKQGELELWMN